MRIHGEREKNYQVPADNTRNRATTSSIFSLYLFLVGIFSIWGGRFCDRFGPRIVVMGMGIVIGFSLLIAISMLWLSWADQMWKFYR